MLFEKTTLPKAAPIKRMRVADAGEMTGGKKGICFVCSRCGHDTGWIEDVWTISENKRGLPCPCCNRSEGAENG